MNESKNVKSKIIDQANQLFSVPCTVSAPCILCMNEDLCKAVKSFRDEMQKIVGTARSNTHE